MKDRGHASPRDLLEIIPRSDEKKIEEIKNIHKIDNGDKIDPISSPSRLHGTGLHFRAYFFPFIFCSLLFVCSFISSAVVLCCTTTTVCTHERVKNH